MQQLHVRLQDEALHWPELDVLEKGYRVYPLHIACPMMHDIVYHASLAIRKLGSLASSHCTHAKNRTLLAQWSRAQTSRRAWQGRCRAGRMCGCWRRTQSCVCWPAGSPPS